jgi:hypothetical protein
LDGPHLWKGRSSDLVAQGGGAGLLADVAGGDARRRCEAEAGVGVVAVDGAKTSGEVKGDAARSCGRRARARRGERVKVRREGGGVGVWGRGGLAQCFAG